jgi:hypothetical protein
MSMWCAHVAGRTETSLKEGRTERDTCVCDMMSKPLLGKYQGGWERSRGVGRATLSQLSAAASELTSG